MCDAVPLIQQEGQLAWTRLWQANYSALWHSEKVHGRGRDIVALHTIEYIVLDDFNFSWGLPVLGVYTLYLGYTIVRCIV